MARWREFLASAVPALSALFVPHPVDRRLLPHRAFENGLEVAIEQAGQISKEGIYKTAKVCDGAMISKRLSQFLVSVQFQIILDIQLTVRWLYDQRGKAAVRSG